MSKLKIPFGWHIIDQVYKDAQAESVQNGDQCGCICDCCGKPLQAVQGEKRGDYFRHKSLSGCTGGLESLMHKLAKQILNENRQIHTGLEVQFEYDHCEIEIPRYSKRPDIYVKNSRSGKSLIVEIYYRHRIEKSTLDCYWRNNEKVLEVDISETRKRIFNYQELTKLILQDGPRDLLELTSGLTHQATPIPQWLKWLAGVILVGILYRIFFKKKKMQTRNKMRW